MKVEAHIYIITSCDVCGYEHGEEDYDSPDVMQAINKVDLVCPKCEENV